MMLCGRCGQAPDMEGLRFAGQFPVEGLLCSICRMAPPAFECDGAYVFCEDELREMVHLRADGSDWKSFGSANSR